ncbi:helicase-associated domain-containing protein [Mycolicibacterium frederiksbergense]|uniref:helicase-associated domain-containing protein n=1 Tax=Mycolicibacterium frederiksbergense TaxID=117567 RepID=UPI00265C0430|nr:helicase-associated domain-containing protein [Mycolicibacterium frederiksbergense]MDO0974880.1 helicase-associated domain-containing protein [Mycolicibacterium frederiksbergense]
MTKVGGAGVPLGVWLADLPDESLVRLLECRPDLTQPPPGTIAALAARAQARQSVKAATDALDFLHLAVLDALLVLHADTAPVPRDMLLEYLGDRADSAALKEALDALADRALIWGEDVLRVVAETAAGLPWYPGQAVPDVPDLPADEIPALLEDLDDPSRELLTRLVEGSPVGRTRDALPGTPADRPVQRLLAAGLLHRIGSDTGDTVILPRVVAQVMRGDLPGPTGLRTPDPTMHTTTQADVDSVAAGAAIDLLREFDVLIQTLSSTPVPELRSGGLGVREVKKLTKLTGIDEQRLGLILEVAAAAGLIAPGTPDPEPADGNAPYWAPTVAADRFIEISTAARWQLVAWTWLNLPARPSLVGSRGPDGKPFGVLSDALYSTAAPLDRRLLLTVLNDLPAGAGVEPESAALAMVWQRPRWAARLQLDPVTNLLREAHAVGLVGRGAIATPARLLLNQRSDDDAEAVINAMAKVLPAPLDHFLLQADLTVVVPGPLLRELAEQLDAVATVESAGAAMVYRISEPSIRRALDAGHTAGGLHAFFEKHSKTPVPQGLTYLIDDVARRHGQLRVGMAASFVRCEDPALLAQAVSTPAAEPLELRILAPTVAVSQASIGDVLAALRAGGFVPAAEDSTGAVVDIRARGARVPAPGRRRVFRPLTAPGTQTLGAIVAVMRSVAASPRSGERLDPAVLIALLQQAALEQTSVVMGYVDPAGVATQRVVSPINIRGGQLTAFDPASGRVREFAIHRVTSVVSADSG